MAPMAESSLIDTTLRETLIGLSRAFSITRVPKERALLKRAREETLKEVERLELKTHPVSQRWCKDKKLTMVAGYRDESNLISAHKDWRA